MRIPYAMAVLLSTGLGAHGCVEQRAHPEMAKAECMQDDQCGDKKVCVQLKCVMPDQAIAACGSSVRVQFATSSTDVPLTEQPALERLAKCLQRYPSHLVIIEGYADQRGPTQRNLMLAHERSRAVKDFLRAEGVLESQLQTATFGEAHPACRARTEACWAQNRRAAVITAAMDKAARRF